MAGVGTGKKARNGYRLSTTFVSIQDIIVLTFIIRGILYKREFGRLVQAIRRGPSSRRVGARVHIYRPKTNCFMNSRSSALGDGDRPECR